MKFLKLALITLSLSTNTQAELSKRIDNVKEYTTDFSLKETKNTFDSILNKSTKKKEYQTTNGISSTIQKTYTFTHKFVMQIQSGEQNTTINYFLNNDNNYIGSSIDLENNNTKMVTVMDMSEKRASMFMEINNQKTQMSIPLDLDNRTANTMEEQEVKITPTGKTKTILNYTCQEYKVEGKDYFGNVWTTQDAEISFSKAFYKTKAKKGLNQPWMSTVNGLTMEMNITDTSKIKEQTIVMRCITLEKSTLTINGNDYKKMF